MDERAKAYWAAVLNMFQTVFICLVLGTGAIFFSRDANLREFVSLKSNAYYDNTA
ncbi:hypothetical protein Pmar_PMAR019137 [Perkinsus marinus ATCC 50983]|uniref:Uncharacterized protein n=1 Tax=Perkinsus marinus (strain ATCC 50983 / TXsc) TaxID=423536 RepID=C5KTZ0_PERM5|nr:hypothetical protein Pmar_PMAR019137 [Perkinsus marinus ATCC 50983]EER12032.1 hypothetical protein Pmar_PMAR019137 [Perkinsus marinus ATCC 50983]|eukprot:XP_002780237.1 hypothetical protein Pmar_PMAR019137 [Perkinsus marinus ATCC 50983]